VGSGDLRYVFMANCKGPEMWVELREDGGVEDQGGQQGIFYGTEGGK